MQHYMLPVQAMSYLLSNPNRVSMSKGFACHLHFENSENNHESKHFNISKMLYMEQRGIRGYPESVSKKHQSDS